MQPIQPFDPSSSPSGQFALQLANGGWLALYNESPIGISVQLGFGDEAYKVPPYFLRVKRVVTRNPLVTWTQDKKSDGTTYALPVGQAPISQIIGEAYDPVQWELGEMLVPMPRQVNFGNPAAGGSVGTLINDGAAVGTTIIESTETGSAGSNLLAKNDGTLGISEWTGTALNKLFGITPNPGLGVDHVQLGRAGGNNVHVLSNAQFDGTINQKGAAPGSSAFVDGLDMGNGTKLGSFGSAAVDLQALSSGVVLVNGGAKVVLKGSTTGVEFQDSTGAVKATVDQTGVGSFATTANDSPWQGNVNQQANKRVNLGGKIGTVTAAAFIGEGNIFGTENEMTIHSNGQNLSVMGDTTLYLKIDNYFDGVNDRVTTANAQPIQVRLDHLGLAIRFSTNSGPTGTVITWGGFNYFPRTSFFNGTGAGTFSHGLATGPNWVGITENVTNSTETVGADTLGVSTVHVNLGVGGTAWLGTAMGF